LCVAIVGATMIRLMQWVYLSTGTTMRQLRWSFVTTPVILAAVISGGLRFGPVGVPAMLAVATCVLAVPSALNAIRGTPLTLADCFGVIVRPLIAAVAGALVLFAVDPRLPAVVPLLALAMRLPVFGTAYVAGWLLQPGGRRTLGELTTRARSILRRR
jgi:hypothetical protein